jgi:hypothetical protein
MVKPEELRIGNNILADGKIVKIEAVTTCMVSVSGFEEGRFTPFEFKRRLEPILLSEDITRDCGLERFRGNFNWIDFKIGEYRFHFRTHNDIANCFGIQKAGSSGHDIYYFNWNIKYLHQLQNLYYALTGHELIYKPQCQKPNH